VKDIGIADSQYCVPALQNTAKLLLADFERINN